uniref:F-box/kelch-repeat protein n=1 Tax=Noccaea caerulescens TaxID=107243 RepID=A0A1J3K9L8_NOCCA
MWAFLLFLCTRFFRLVMFSKTMAAKSESSESPFPIMSSKTMAEKDESSESPFPIRSLPEDIIVDIIARVRRCDHPTLSLVSKHLRSIVSSPELYARRSLLGRTEHRLYVLLHLSDYNTSKKCWYVLRNRRFVPVSTPLPTSGSFIAAGSKIYVFGMDCYSTTAVSIQCPSHTVKTLPSMPYMLTRAASIIDGKIHVSGNCDYDGFEVSMLVFNTETQMWEPEIIEPDIKVFPLIRSSVVMADKIYIATYQNSIFYHPKERTWGKDEMLDSKMWNFANACVVDDVLYYYDASENCLRTYDPNKRCWGVVNGLDDLLVTTRGSLRGSETVSYSGKLALFFLKEAVRGNGIWCAEISLETRQGGEIWGKVEWCHQVLIVEDEFAFEFPIKLLPVML